jgi:hypothetical protein
VASFVTDLRGHASSLHGPHERTPNLPPLPPPSLSPAPHHRQSRPPEAHAACEDGGGGAASSPSLRFGRRGRYKRAEGTAGGVGDRIRCLRGWIRWPRRQIYRLQVQSRQEGALFAMVAEGLAGRRERGVGEPAVPLPGEWYVRGRYGDERRPER